MKNGFIVLLKYLVLPMLILAVITCLLLGALIVAPSYSIIGIIILILLGVVSYAVKNKTDKMRGWRVLASGLGPIYYAELREGKWEKIEIDGERLAGKPHHVIYPGSLEKWKSYPEWAHHRREEIVSRLKSVLKEPEYKYLKSTGDSYFLEHLS